MGRLVSELIFGLDGLTGLMANHVDGRMSWNLSFDAARTAELAVMPEVCPVCVLSVHIA